MSISSSVIICLPSWLSVKCKRLLSLNLTVVVFGKLRPCRCYSEAEGKTRRAYVRRSFRFWIRPRWLTGKEALIVLHAIRSLFFIYTPVWRTYIRALSSEERSSLGLSFPSTMSMEWRPCGLSHIFVFIIIFIILKCTCKCNVNVSKTLQSKKYCQCFLYCRTLFDVFLFIEKIELKYL